MSTMNIQFHMLPSEIIAFVSDIRSKHAVSIELERWHPKAVRTIPPLANVSTEVQDFGIVDRIWLIVESAAPRLSERFMLNIGSVKGEKLQQSQFGGETRSPLGYRVCKQLASELRRRTRAGLWIIGEHGSVGFKRSFRVSPGAMEASRRGHLKLTNVAWTQVFCVDAPSSTK